MAAVVDGEMGCGNGSNEQRRESGFQVQANARGAERGVVSCRSNEDDLWMRVFVNVTPCHL
jgi:hypothetical protein